MEMKGLMIWLPLLCYEIWTKPPLQTEFFSKSSKYPKTKIYNSSAIRTLLKIYINEDRVLIMLIITFITDHLNSYLSRSDSSADNPLRMMRKFSIWNTFPFHRAIFFRWASLPGFNMYNKNVSNVWQHFVSK